LSIAILLALLSFFVDGADFFFLQGTTIEYAGERAGCSLSSMGWTGKRGTPSMPPVWVVVHKV
jgi:hypothetical protein